MVTDAVEVLRVLRADIGIDGMLDAFEEAAVMWEEEYTPVYKASVFTVLRETAVKSSAPFLLMYVVKVRRIGFWIMFRQYFKKI